MSPLDPWGPLLAKHLPQPSSVPPRSSAPALRPRCVAPAFGEAFDQVPPWHQVAVQEFHLGLQGPKEKESGELR